MTDPTNLGPLVIIHVAGSSTEAMVIRGLLESAGIHSPEPSGPDPFPTGTPGLDTAAVNIEVPKSQSEDAKRIIGEYLTPADVLEIQPDDQDPPGSSVD